MLSFPPPAGWTHSPLHRLDLEPLRAVREVDATGAAAITREYRLSSLFHVAQVPAPTCSQDHNAIVGSNLAGKQRRSRHHKPTAAAAAPAKRSTREYRRKQFNSPEDGDHPVLAPAVHVSQRPFVPDLSSMRPIPELAIVVVSIKRVPRFRVPWIQHAPVVPKEADL